MRNLDLECAKLGRELAEGDGKVVDEKVLTAALGVLEEQGPYACFLYLIAREGALGKRLTTQAAQFLKKILSPRNGEQDPLQYVQSIAENLDHLLFARDLLRQAFVYARYHAKARGSAGGKE
jgi:hypothetical protein